MKTIKEIMVALMVAAMVVTPVALLIGFTVTGNQQYLEALGWYGFYWASYILAVFSLGFTLIVTFMLPLMFLASMLTIGTIAGTIGFPITIAMMALTIWILISLPKF